MISRLYEREHWGNDDPERLCFLYPALEILRRRIDPGANRLVLALIARYGTDRQKKAICTVLGTEDAEAYAEKVIADCTSDGIFDAEYLLAEEQIRLVDDAEHLKAAAYEAGYYKSRFAFCRLTGYSFPSPENDAYSHRTFRCERLAAFADEDVRTFCEEMIQRRGPFAEEAAEILSGRHIAEEAAATREGV